MSNVTNESSICSEAMKHSATKEHGVHYTPPDLAEFLATVTTDLLDSSTDSINVLDPACGHGALLRAVVAALPPRTRRRIRLVGYESDINALRVAKDLLAQESVASVDLHHGDFLSLDTFRPAQRTLFDKSNETSELFDITIANPPYVRTQILGAKKAQALARRFNLSGRVDLYQVFTKAMGSVLKPGGIMGLLEVDPNRWTADWGE